MLVSGVVQKSSRQVAEAEARGAGPSAEAAAGAASTHRRRRCRGDGDGGRSFEPKQAATTEARARHGQLRSRGGVVRSRGRDEANFGHRWLEEIENDDPALPRFYQRQPPCIYVIAL